MSDDKPIYYSNKDYTVRMEIADGVKRYFIRYHSLNNSPEYEISLEIFMLYHKEFNKPLERQKNEHRRHIEVGDADIFLISGEVTVVQFEQEQISKADLEAALKLCTPIQKRRFELHYIQDYSFTEIAKMENCGIRRVKKSVDDAVKKIKKYFL